MQALCRGLHGGFTWVEVVKWSCLCLWCRMWRPTSVLQFCDVRSCLFLRRDLKIMQKSWAPETLMKQKPWNVKEIVGENDSVTHVSAMCLSWGYHYQHPWVDREVLLVKASFDQSEQEGCMLVLPVPPLWGGQLGMDMAHQVGCSRCGRGHSIDRRGNIGYGLFGHWYSVVT